MFITLDDFIAGWTGGICGLLIGHPVDTIKVRQQTLGGENIYNATRRTFKYEGIFGFYKGMLLPMVTFGPSNAIFFGVYGNVMKALQHQEKQDHKISPRDSLTIERVFIAGALAGFSQVLFTCPVELIKTTLQAKTGIKGHWKEHYEAPYKGSIDALLGILRDRGVRGLYRGCVVMMFRDIPTSGLYTLTYEMLLYSNFSQCETPILVKQMIAGGCAGIVGWIPVIPLDVIKSRMQADNPDKPKYTGTIDCFVKTYQHGGFPIFFRGFTATILRAFPVNAAIFIGYETVLSQLRV